MAEPIAVNPPDYLTVAAGRPALPILPGPVHAGGTSAVDATAAAFGAATNLNLAETNTQLAEEHADRIGHAADAAGKFTAGEGDAAQQFQDVTDTALPGGLDGVLQGVTGALSGVLGSVSRLPQGLLQAGQGVLSPLMSAAQSLGQAGLGEATLASDDEPDFGAADGDEFGAGGGIAGLGTTPAGNLGPPPVPGTSTPTTPAGSMSRPAVAGPGAGAPAAGGPGGGMLPLMPGGAGAVGKTDAGAAAKRIAAPAIPNGQPVKGRTTAPPHVPVTRSVAEDPGLPRITPLKRIAGKPDSWSGPPG